MIRLIFAFFTIFICYINNSGAFANDEFLKELFSPVELIKIANLQRSYPPLSESDKKDLLQAKNTFVSFLTSWNERGHDPMQYLPNDLQRKYKNTVDLYQKEFGAESLLEIEIFDFLIKRRDHKEIIFYVALTNTTEGEDRTIQTAFALKKTGQYWKLSRFVRDIKFREAEEKTR
jgi:hypothetical protein